MHRDPQLEPGVCTLQPRPHPRLCERPAGPRSTTVQGQLSLRFLSGWPVARCSWQ